MPKKIKITSVWTERIRKINGRMRKVIVKKIGKRTLVRMPKKKTKYLKPKILKRSIHQKSVKKHDISKDKQRIALPPGKRRSKSGKIYTEHRTNRTDKNPKKKL